MAQGMKVSRIYANKPLINQGLCKGEGEEVQPSPWLWGSRDGHGSSGLCWDRAAWGQGHPGPRVRDDLALGVRHAP